KKLARHAGTGKTPDGRRQRDRVFSSGAAVVLRVLLCCVNFLTGARCAPKHNFEGAEPPLCSPPRRGRYKRGIFRLLWWRLCRPRTSVLFLVRRFSTANDTKHTKNRIIRPSTGCMAKARRIRRAF